MALTNAKLKSLKDKIEQQAAAVETKKETSDTVKKVEQSKTKK